MYNLIIIKYYSYYSRCWKG